MQPIWQDYFHEFGIAGTPHQFQVLVGGEIIYQGTAYPTSETDFPKIRLNDICADYLCSVLPLVGYTEYSENPKIRQTFFIKDLTTPTPMPPSVTFINDWSYQQNVDYLTTGVNSDPIRRTFVKGQYIFIGYTVAPEIISGTITNLMGQYSK